VTPGPATPGPVTPRALVPRPQAAEGMGKPGLVDIRPRMDEFIFHVEPIGQHDPRVLCDLMVQETKRKLRALRMHVQAAVARADPTQLLD